MLDFIGNEVLPNSFIAWSGSGNKDAEYGMILGKVVEINDKANTVICHRLDVSIIDGKPFLKRIRKEGKKFVVAPQPSFLIQQWFDEGFPFSDEHTKLIRDWLHHGVYPLENTKGQYNRDV